MWHEAQKENTMWKHSILIVVFLMNFGCGNALTGKSDQGGVTVANTNSDPTSSSSEDSGLTEVCTVETVLDGVQITCGEEVYLIKNGKDGENGEDGEDGASGTIGPQGAQGIPGIQGEVGPAGSDAQLHLYDANDQDLGILVDTDGSTYRTYLSNLNVVIGFRSFTIQETNPHTVSINSPGGQSIAFNQHDCMGQLYVEALANGTESWGLQQVYKYPDLDGYYRRIPNASTIDLAYSSISWPVNGCTNNPTSSVVQPFYPLEEIELPFEEPLAWPLQIRLLAN